MSAICVQAECMVDDYITQQTDVTPNMRAVLVDWMVEVQENFELNHETLYLAVRLTDHYLMKKNVSKDALQLVGAAAIFIGCKFDVSTKCAVEWELMAARGVFMLQMNTLLLREPC